MGNIMLENNPWGVVEAINIWGGNHLKWQKIAPMISLPIGSWKVYECNWKIQEKEEKNNNTKILPLLENLS